MFLTRRVVDTEAAAERVKAGGGAGKFLSGDSERIDGAVKRDRGFVKPAQLGIDELHVETGVMDHQFGVADEGDEIVSDGGEDRLFRKSLGGKAMNLERLGRHVAFGVDILMIDPARRHVVHQLDAADFHDPVAVMRVETGRLRVHHDLTHRRLRSALP